MALALTVLSYQTTRMKTHLVLLSSCVIFVAACAQRQQVKPEEYYALINSKKRISEHALREFKKRTSDQDMIAVLNNDKRA